MIVLPASAGGIGRAAEIIRGGALAAFPTETVYGLGADAFNTRALARVFEAKGRPRFDPLIIHIAALAALDRIAALDLLSPGRRQLLEKLVSAFWPGPLTLILPKRPEVPDLATAGLATAAIRFPAHPVAQALIAASTGAVAAPSANPFGRLSPTRAEHVIEGLGDKIDCVIDGGPCEVGIESTVLDLVSGQPRILRPGGVEREALEAVAGACAAGPASVPVSGAPSPGLLKSHYAPAVPLVLHSPAEMAALPFVPEEGCLFFSGKDRDTWLNNAGKIPDGRYAQVLALSESGSVLEAAANLFEYLHLLDRAGLSRIHAQVLPQEGLGAAVNDRLRRAAG